MLVVRLVVLGGSAAVLAGGLWAQGYSPGQSFSPGRQQPAPQQTPVARQPVYQAAPAQVPSRPSYAQPYNIGTPAPRATVRSTLKPTATPRPRTTSALKTEPIAEKTQKPQITLRGPKTYGETSRPGAKYLTSWPTGQKLIALTYDDGPDARYTPKLLDYLAEAKVPATFYVCGNRVKSAPQTLARIAAEGHEVANHTWDHPLLTKLSPEKIRHQLVSTQEAVEEAAPGTKITTMRPPFGGGVSTKTLQDICAELGYKIVIWDIDTEDWKKRSPQYMTKVILDKASDGSIVLMHDRLHGGQDTILPTTKVVVEGLRQRGYTFVRVDYLLSRPHESEVAAGVESKPAAVHEPSETLSNQILPDIVEVESTDADAERQ